MMSEHMRYFGVLGLLCECAVYVPADVRDQIDSALTDACNANPQLHWRGILDSRVIEVDHEGATPGLMPCPDCNGIGAPWNNSASILCERCCGSGRIPSR